jgi:hypothetical protein
MNFDTLAIFFSLFEHAVRARWTIKLKSHLVDCKGAVRVLLHAQFRALHAAMAQKSSECPEAPNSQVLAVLMWHGGLYTLLDRDMMTARLVPILTSRANITPESAANFITSLGSAAASFFIHLKPTTGEDLAAFYGIQALTPKQIDPDPIVRELYVARDANGNLKMAHGHDTFQMPLWYYLLKEAELQGKTKGSLGQLGSRLVAEVILGAIAWTDEFVFKKGHKDPTWTSKVPLADRS